MKRLDIERLLIAAGFILKEGGNHTLVYTADGKRISSVPRHKEIKEQLASKILYKDCGLKKN